jgi:hypothetical protein
MTEEAAEKVELGLVPGVSVTQGLKPEPLLSGAYWHD